VYVPTCHFQKKLPKINNYPNSLNLVTLVEKERDIEADKEDRSKKEKASE
jgi:hypothetical protein